MCTYTSALRNPSVAGVRVVVSYHVNAGLLEEQPVLLAPDQSLSPPVTVPFLVFFLRDPHCLGFLSFVSAARLC